VVVCSPYVRARETAEIVADVFDGVKILETDFLVPEAEPEDFSDWAEKNLDGIESAFVVSHEPYLGCLLGLFLDGDKNAARPFRKAAVACVEWEPDGEATLQWSIHPGAIR
jgi:phosphohistidine phosphatase